MNDCVWGLVAHCGCGDYMCRFYLSIDSAEGQLIERQYWQDVENALEPVWAEYERVRKSRAEGFKGGSDE